MIANYKEEIEGVARHLLTIVGGILISKGWADEALVAQIVGLAGIVLGIAFSLIQKRNVKAEVRMLVEAQNSLMTELNLHSQEVAKSKCLIEDNNCDCKK